MKHWITEALFYHIYPLGAFGAPKRNDFTAAPVNRLSEVESMIPHLKELGVNALYIGPLFESTAHGYDTISYYHVDRRLGTNDDLKALVNRLHEAGIRVILDGVFNHAGRDFFAFKDLRANGSSSAYRDWFTGIDFSGKSPLGDPFTYNGWAGCFDLVKFNTNNPDLRAHLLDAVRMWIREFKIDGLRLDAADVIDTGFLRELSAVCRAEKNDFWMTGEIVHGDYTRLLNAGGLDSATNYECYKGLWSSFNDKNFFEIAYALNRQFGDGGLYRGKSLYNFIDNHDVNRIASTLSSAVHLYPLYGLLMTMPGVPSIYYGSEFGMEGVRTATSDDALRQVIDLSHLKNNSTHASLASDIKRLADCRRSSAALAGGDYREVHVAHEQIVFSRSDGGETVIVALNSSGSEVCINLNGKTGASKGYDILNGEEVSFHALTVPANWLRIVRI